MAPFQYQPYRNPYVQSISDLMQRPAEAQARAAEIGGAAWNQSAQQLGRIAITLPQQMQEQQQFQQQQQQHAQQQADLAALDKAFQQPGGRDAILGALPGHLRPAVTKQFNDADESAAKVQKATTEAASASNDYVGSLAAGVKAHNYDPTAAQLALSHAKTTFANNPAMLQQVAQMEQAIQSNPTPDAVRQLIDPLLASSPAQVKLQQSAATEAETSRHNQATEATSAGAQTRMDTAQVETARHNAAMESIGRLTAGREQAAQAETARHNRQMEQIDTQKLGQGAAPGGAPGAPDPVAQAIAEYRVPPPAARSLATPAGQALLQRVSAINPEFDATQFPNRQATRKAFTTGTQGQQINAMNTAIGHLDQLTNAIQGLGNSDVQAANAAKNWIATQLGGSATTNFDTLKVALSGELASVLKKSGATDAEIRSVESTIGSKNSPAQLAGYVQTQIPILGSKLSALNYQYHQAMGEKDPFTALSPEAKGVLTKFGFDPNNPQIGGGGGGGGAKGGPAEGAQQPIPGIAGGIAEFRGGKWVRVK